jgi:hypothetical protein
VPKKNLQLLAQDQKFLKPKIPLLELLILCQNQYVQLWQLIKSLLSQMYLFGTYNLVPKVVSSDLAQDRMHY